MDQLFFVESHICIWLCLLALQKIKAQHKIKWLSYKSCWVRSCTHSFTGRVSQTRVFACCEQQFLYEDVHSACKSQRFQDLISNLFVADMKHWPKASWKKGFISAYRLYSLSPTEILNIWCFSPAGKYNRRLCLGPIISWHTGSWKERKFVFLKLCHDKTQFHDGLEYSMDWEEVLEKIENHWCCLAKAIVGNQVWVWETAPSMEWSKEKYLEGCGSAFRAVVAVGK